MTNYIVTFGTNDEIVNIEIEGSNIPEVLETLKTAGWKLEEVTSVSEVIQ